MWIMDRRRLRRQRQTGGEHRHASSLSSLPRGGAVAGSGGTRLCAFLGLAMLMCSPDVAFVRGQLELAGGKYTASTNPESEAKIALDAAAIKETDDLEIKKSIYLNGQNSQYQDPESLQTVNRSLSSLSLDAPVLMKDDDWYNVYRYSFGYIGSNDEKEEDGNFDGEPIERYANTIVMDLFDLNDEDIETEASLVMNVWMTVVHFLQDAERRCKNSSGGTTLDGLAQLDISAAYYIGWGQIEGDNDSGHLLYNLAENAGARFGTDEEETTANKNVIALMNQLKDEIITAGTCPEDFLKFRSIVRQIVAQMTVPLVQNLIHYMWERKADKLELYALAIMPQVSACDSAGYEFLLDKLVLNTYDPNSFNDVILRLQGLYSCFGITCADVGAYQTDAVPQCDDSKVNGRTSLAGYPLSGSVTDAVRLAAYFDRDLLRMKNLMSLDALNAAKDVYAHGFNSNGSIADLSLNSLLLMKDDDWYNVYRYAFDYIGSKEENENDGLFDDYPVEQYADTVVNDLFKLNREGIETEASAVMNVWMTVAHYLQDAASECRAGNSANVGQRLDLAVAYWIGWGQAEGDNANGRLLYHLAENAAARFGRDDGTAATEAAANTQILSLIGRIKAEIVDADKCPADYATFRSLVNQIVAQMTVPLVQNLIHYMSGGKSEKLELYALAIAPQIAACDEAEFIYFLDKLVLYNYDPATMDEVLGRLQSLYSCLGITCLDVGAYQSDFGTLPQCNDTEAQRLTDLADYKLSNDVGKAAYYNRDLTRMRSLMRMSALAAAKDTYMLGFNAESSLASLSLNSFDIMKDDDLYNIYRYSFRHIGTEDENEDDGLFDDRSIDEYGNTVVEDLFDLNTEGIETEAAIVMNVWMTAAHHLQESAKRCQNGEDQGAIIQQLDLAATFWIGSGQAYGDNSHGHLLYHLTENAGLRFGRDSGAESDTTANRNIISFMRELNAMAGGGGCPTEYAKFRSLVNNIISQMYVPLVQNLIFFMDKNRPEKLELYALAITPQIAACDRNEYEFFLDKLVLSTYETESFQEVVARLQGMFPCLGITCGDIGAYDSGSTAVPLCVDSDLSPSSLAGYQLRANVQEVTYLDRDIQRMNNLISMQALNAAKDVYMYGYNVPLSLQGLATSDGRSIVASEYPLFTAYFNDANYADTIIFNALDKQDIYAGASDEQVREIVVRASQSMVTYMYALQELFGAESVCSSNATEATLSWDRGASVLIGSIGGAETDGHSNGRFIFALSKEVCGYFQTCPTGSSDVNAEIISYLDVGATQISNGNCNGILSPESSPLVSLLKVPNIQGTLHFAAVNAIPSVPLGSPEGSVGSGHALYSSIDPLIADSSLAGIIEDNMKFDLSKKPVSDGAEAVFGAVAQALGDLGVDCEKIGVYSGIEDGKGDLCVLIGEPPIVISPTESVPAPTPAVTAPTPSTSGAQPTEPTTEASFPPSDLGYQFTTGAEDHAFIAYDVRDMQQSDAVISQQVYETGGNANIKDAAGDEVMLVLEQLSLTSKDRMSQDILYNFYRFSFKDEPVFIENSESEVPDSSYANTVVMKAFEIAQDEALAAEASVVMTLFMEIVHQLELAIRYCDEDGDGERSIDVAVALWVGAGQVKGDNNSGYLMYSIAEIAGARFGQDTGETAVNTKILNLFSSAKKLAGDCRTDKSRGEELRMVTHQIISQMDIPLLQNLVYYMNVADPDENDFENYIELYGLAVTPQVAACSPTTFAYLKDELIDYDWDPKDIKDIVIALESSLSCFGLTCDDIGNLQEGTNIVQLCSGNPSLATSMVGYSLSSDASEIAKIDRDILQIYISMQMEAPKAAEDIYLHGRNVKSGNAFQSLHALAVGGDKYDLGSVTGDESIDPFKLFSDYYGSSTYGNEIIMDAFDRTDRFTGASNEQLTEVVVRTLQSMITVMYSLQQMLLGAKKCEDSGNGKESWDMGVAALIGSIEGTSENGRAGGMLMYALAKEKCGLFDTCAESGNANANIKLLNLLSGGSTAVSSGECNNARHIVTNDILPVLELSMIQSVLDYAVINSKLSAGAEEKTLGAGFALGDSILPFVKNVNETSAGILSRNMAFDRDSKPVPDGVNAVFNALAEVTSGMGVDCEAVGKYVNTSLPGVCKDNHPGTDVTISDGIYVTTTYVKEQMKISEDIKAIEQALLSGVPKEARLIYKDGLNSVIYDRNGVRVGMRNLASFSTSASLTMRQEPVFNIMAYGLEDENGLYLGSDVASFGDTVVEAAFTNKNVKTLASEAVVALNLWGYVVHELYQMAENCKNKRLTDDDGVLSLDEAAAYYIGDSQQSGDSSTGHALYALAERMGEKFGTDPGSKNHAAVNSKILTYFGDAKLVLSFNDACVNNPETYPKLRGIIHVIVAQMTVPLMQSLIYYLRENDHDRVKMYAQAVVPLIAGCNPSIHSFLHDELIVSGFNVVKTDEYVKALQSVYSCLGITCEDVGIFETGATCEDTPKSKPLAGYTPMTDVRQIATLDLDIHQIDILMKRRAYNAVRDIYSYGKNAHIQTLQGNELVSLEQLARTSSRETVPSFNYFKHFFEDDFDNDSNAKIYGHYIITRALDEGEMPVASQEQRGELVVKGLQYMVCFMSALQYMYEAVENCESNDSGRKANAAGKWDGAAAILIGSLEGADEGGSADGMMMHNLANKRCQQFGRCNPEGNANANDDLIYLLYAGRGETESANCPALKKTVGEIESLLQVGLVQGTLRYALENQKHQFFVKDGDLAAGYIFSRSILPYVSESDVQAAELIGRNMDFSFVSKPVQDGAPAVFNAFAEALPGMKVDCEKVGRADGMGVCSVEASSFADRNRSVPLFLALFMSLCFVAIL